MKHTPILLFTVITGILLFSSCGQDKKNESESQLTAAPLVTHTDTASRPTKVSMVISSIPFPTNIFDSLHYAHAAYQANFANAAENMAKYSQSNDEAINLGMYGADLSYVISFEQFQQVGSYMKATKYLADKAGVPMAFTQDVIERCQKNAHNKDSLTKLVFTSYVIIDNTLKSNQRKSTETLVLAGGWIEGLYITTQSMQSLSAITDKQGGYNIIMGQKKYLDVLLNQLDLISDNTYCQNVSTGLHEIRGIFNNMDSTKVNDDAVHNLTEKLSSLRGKIVNGGNI